MPVVRRILACALLLSLVLITGGCHTQSNNRVHVGDGVGSGVGAVVGKVGNNGETGAGIGGTAGATVGYLLSSEQERAKAREW
jgi:hypothetical protein